ncbi:hypothetical protein ACTXT7_003422 [Hymenolepis weldensis]
MPQALSDPDPQFEVIIPRIRRLFYEAGGDSMAADAFQLDSIFNTLLNEDHRLPYTMYLHVIDIQSLCVNSINFFPKRYLVESRCNVVNTIFVGELVRHIYGDVAEFEPLTKEVS